MMVMPVKSWEKHPSSCAGAWTWTRTFPASTMTIDRQMSSGTLLGDWINHYYSGFQTYCVKSAVAPGSGVGDSYNLYIGSQKPEDVFLSADVPSVTVEGASYPVWTTTALQALGLGYILRWQVEQGYFGLHHHTIRDVVGDWVTPPSTWNGEWLPPPGTGIPFYLASFGNCSACKQLEINVNSLTEWWQYAPLHPFPSISFIIGNNINLRYVLLKPAGEISSSNAVDFSTQTVTTTELIKFIPAPNSEQGRNVIMQHTITVSLPPSGSCTTPTGAEAVIYVGTVNQSQLEAQGDAGAWRGFNFTLRNCPRVPVHYYAHAQGKWVDSAQGIVGMPGSAPDADPAIGNPRGFGIQLQHGTGGHQHSGNVYLHPNALAPGAVPDPGQSYTRTYPGEGAENDPGTGVTHTIPLRARIIRTSPSGPSIQPGPFSTTMMFVIHYP